MPEMNDAAGKRSMAELTLRICHLYPELMNIYGDRGNIIALRKRCEWRGLGADVTGLSIHQEVDPEAYDFYFMGGGQDREQILVANDLINVKGDALRVAAADGAGFLTICGGYQLFGKYFLTYTGETLPGIEIFDAWTEGAEKRFIGNMVIEWETAAGGKQTLVGFENHSGHTYLGHDTKPLGRVLEGFGNNGEDGMEGSRAGNAIGTYLHGSLLPKNPRLADEIILAALRRRYGIDALPPLDDALEERAHEAAVRRTRGSGARRSGRFRKG